MHLDQEYLKRHNIEIPYVKYVHTGCVFFKSEKFSDERWHLLTINWKEPTWHPGVYYVKEYKPIHDGFRGGELFCQISEKKLFLEEYEDYFLGWRKGIARVASEEEVPLAVWEVCLCCYDSLLAPYAGRQDFLATVDFDLPIAHRLKALEQVIAHFDISFPFFVEAWQQDIHRYTKGYAKWITELVTIPQ